MCQFQQAALTASLLIKARVHKRTLDGYAVFSPLRDCQPERLSVSPKPIMPYGRYCLLLREQKHQFNCHSLCLFVKQTRALRCNAPTIYSNKICTYYTLSACMFSVCVKDVYVQETQLMYVFVCEKKVQSRIKFLVRENKCVKRVNLEMGER